MLLLKLHAAFSIALLTAPARAEGEPPAPKDIVATAVGAKKFTLLVEAVRAADLADTLKGTGPFTLFAPTDAAFKALSNTLGEKKYKALMADKARLNKFVLGHVVVEKSLVAEDVIKMDSKKLNDFEIRVKGEMIMIGGAKVTKTDIQCKNGVMHVIDKVLIADEK